MTARTETRPETRAETTCLTVSRDPVGRDTGDASRSGAQRTSGPAPTPARVGTTRLPRAHVRVTGDLDLATVPLLEAVVTDAARRSGEVVLDLAALRFCDLHGLRALLRLRERHAPRVLVAAVPASVQRVADAAGLDCALAAPLVAA